MALLAIRQLLGPGKFILLFWPGKAEAVMFYGRSTFLALGLVAVREAAAYVIFYLPEYNG